MASQGKVAIVTGGGSGIGRSAALALQGDGWNVVVSGRRKEELDKTVAMAKAGGGKMLAVRADVGKQEDVKSLFAETKKTFGRLDFLFNNAGFGAPAVPMEDLTLQQWQAVVDTILTGSFLCTQEAIKIMKSQTPKGGRIVNNGSISAHTPRPNSVAYTATQARHHRPHQVHGARRAQARHRLRPARHRQCRHGHGRAHEGRRNAGLRRGRARGGVRRGALRLGHPLHGEPAARHQRAVHEHQGHQDAVRRPRLTVAPASRPGVGLNRDAGSTLLGQRFARTPLAYTPRGRRTMNTSGIAIADTAVYIQNAFR